VVDHITVNGMGRGANNSSNPSTSNPSSPTPPPQI